MKKKLILSFTILVTLIAKSFGQNSSIHVESRSNIQENLTYIVDITFDENNNATITRTTRTYSEGDKSKGEVFLSESDYEVDQVNSNISINSNGNQRFIYDIDDNVLLGITNGGPPLVLHVWCQSWGPCSLDGTCTVVWTLSNNQLNAGCAGGCARCELKANASGGGINPTNLTGGYIVFDGTTATN